MPLRLPAGLLIADCCGGLPGAPGTWAAVDRMLGRRYWNSPGGREGVLDKLDFGRTFFGEDDSDEVKPPIAVEKAVSVEIMTSRAGGVAPLLVAERLERRSVLARGERSHLYKSDGFSVLGDDVNFAVGGRVVYRADAVSLPAKKLAGNLFSFFAEVISLFRHGGLARFCTRELSNSNRSAVSHDRGVRARGCGACAICRTALNLTDSV